MSEYTFDDWPDANPFCHGWFCLKNIPNPSLSAHDMFLITHEGNESLIT